MNKLVVAILFKVSIETMLQFSHRFSSCKRHSYRMGSLITDVGVGDVAATDVGVPELELISMFVALFRKVLKLGRLSVFSECFDFLLIVSEIFPICGWLLGLSRFLSLPIGML